MKVKEIRDMNGTELLETLDELRSELFNLRFRLVTGQLENPMRIKEVRKSIARIKTILRERELSIG